MSRIIVLLLLFFSLSASAQLADFVSEVETAHAKQEFASHEAISFDITLRFGGTERLNARMTLSTDGGAGLIEYADGEKLLFKGNEIYHSPGLEGKKGLRFTAYTWSYFFMFPFKLSDQGTNWSAFDGVSTVEGEVHDTGKLTFDAGTGDAPDDWYIAYADKSDHLLRAAAYIVTAGATQDEAEEDPHAIEYSKYQDVEGVPISTKWNFWAWRTGQGLTDRLGDADISNIRFEESKKNVLFSTSGLQLLN